MTLICEKKLTELINCEIKLRIAWNLCAFNEKYRNLIYNMQNNNNVDMLLTRQIQRNARAVICKWCDLSRHAFRHLTIIFLMACKNQKEKIVTNTNVCYIIFCFKKTSSLILAMYQRKLQNRCILLGHIIHNLQICL